ncbi:MAG: hypothetical protein KHY89_06320 [Butyricicoccus pullicaecorum]|nr:hypothetical protein [Butyricicoccus pullicaecorum]
MLFKYHQSKYGRHAGRMFVINLTENQTWLEDIIPQELLTRKGCGNLPHPFSPVFLAQNFCFLIQNAIA